MAVVSGRFGYLSLFNFRPTQIEQRPYDDPNHRLVKAGRISCDMCLDLTDKKNLFELARHRVEMTVV